MQMRSKLTVEYLKTRGAQNSSDNGSEFLRSLLVRISCQMNFARLNRSLHAPPGYHNDILLYRCFLCPHRATSVPSKGPGPYILYKVIGLSWALPHGVAGCLRGRGFGSPGGVTVGHGGH
jgi:hypothetical protein